MKLLNSRLLIVIKLAGTFLLLLVIFVLTLSFAANKILADVWQQLGITQTHGNNNIYYSVRNGYLAYSIKNAKNISPKDRIAIINQLVTYAKKYTSSEEFKKKYENERKLIMPAKPQTESINVDSIKVAERQRIEMQIKQTEANANHANSKVRNAVPYRIEALKKELKSVEDGTCACIQNKVKQMESWNEAAMNHQKKELEKLETDLPPNPQDLIRRRLQEMLEVTADVDYSAELKDGYANKFKVFVNPVYEKKSKDWKLAFRAGKETTDLVRAAAQKWLSEMSTQQRLKGPGPVGG
jgi:hypothetical protein